MSACCWVLHSRLTYFWRNVNISSIFFFSKSTSINTQYSCLWDTLKMMLFTKYLIKMKTHWQNQLKISALVYFKILYRIRYKKIDVILVQCPFNVSILYPCFWYSDHKWPTVYTLLWNFIWMFNKKWSFFLYFILGSQEISSSNVVHLIIGYQSVWPWRW